METPALAPARRLIRAVGVAFVLGAAMLVLYSSLVKFTDIEAFRKTLESHSLLPGASARAASWAIPAAMRQPHPVVSCAHGTTECHHGIVTRSSACSCVTHSWSAMVVPRAGHDPIFNTSKIRPSPPSRLRCSSRTTSRTCGNPR